MTARVIDGKAVAAKLRGEYKQRIVRMRAEHGVTPGLAVILVGEDPASQVYVRNKIRDCAEVGIRSELIELPATIAEAELLARIDALNADTAVHGILIQLPLPPHVADPQGAGAHLGGQGRRRIPSLQRRRPGHRPPGVPALHSLWRAEAAGAREHRARRPQRRGGRRQQHRRQTDRDDAHAAGRDGLDLSQEDARPRRSTRCSPTSSWSPPACPG